MDYAAERGHLDVVQWLHHNQREGCTAQAMDCAMMRGDFEIVLFLHANRSEGCTDVIVNSEHVVRHLEMFAWVCEHYHDKVSISRLLRNVNLANHPYLEAVLEEVELLPLTQR